MVAPPIVPVPLRRWRLWWRRVNQAMASFWDIRNAALFYDRLFEIDPTSRPLFKSDTLPEQKRKLIGRDFVGRETELAELRAGAREAAVL